MGLFMGSNELHGLSEPLPAAAFQACSVFMHFWHLSA